MEVAQTTDPRARVFLEALGRKIESQGIPAVAGIEITERCNLTCVHCYLGDQKALRARKKDELSTEEWKRVLDQIADLGCLRILITGGDPMLRPDFADIYRHAKELGLLVTVFTNGTLITKRILELFRELPPYAVEVSLYGATEETYEKVTGVPGSYRRCIEGIERLRDLGIALGLKTVLMRPNQHEFDQIAEMARSLGNLPFRFDYEVQGAFGADLGPLSHRLDPEEAVRIEFSDPGAAKTWVEYADRRAGLTVPRKDAVYNCGAGRSSIHVNPYGQLQPCLLTRHLGHDLRSIPLTEALAAIREKIENKRAPAGSACNTCEDRAICSACPAFAVQETGDESQPAAFQCQVTKARRRMIDQQRLLPVWGQAPSSLPVAGQLGGYAV